MGCSCTHCRSVHRRCDGVLRLPGESNGADQDVAIARERGIPVWHRVEDVPGYVGGAA